MMQVTIKEAREILGSEATTMSDEELQSLIDDLSVMAKWAIKEAARLHVQDSLIASNRSKNDLTEV